MEKPKIIKKIMVMILSFHIVLTSAFSSVYANEINSEINLESSIETESEENTELTIETNASANTEEAIETETAENAEGTIETETAVNTEEAIETQAAVNTEAASETEVESETEANTNIESIMETNIDFSDTKGKNTVTEEAIQTVLGYYNCMLSYDDLVKMANAGYDVSGFTEDAFLEQIALQPSVFSRSEDHDATYVGQASISYSKADADKMYLFGSNSYYNNGTYTRIYQTKKRITFGSKVYIGFCFEPSGASPTADTLLDCHRLNNCPNIVKALYYGYGGPEFETGGFKSLLDGISESNSYFYSGGRENCYEVLTHCLIGKLYGDTAWAMGLSQESADAVIAMESILNQLPGPVNPMIKLQKQDGTSIENEVTYKDGNYQRTSTLCVSGDSRNRLTITLPNEVEAVDDNGKVYSGTFSLNGGTDFYLRAGLNYTGTYNSGELKGVYDVNYVPYVVFGGDGTKQDCGTLFAETYSQTTAMSVVFKASTGNLILKKTSSDPMITDNNSNYTLDGAKYSVYSDTACTKYLGTLVTNSSGISNELTLTSGIYYVKETTAPPGYQVDSKIHKVTINGGSTTTLDVEEIPITGKLTIKKNSSFNALYENNESYRNLTATFGVYNALNIQVGSVQTDGNGNGCLSGIAIGTYTVKEITPPTGYTLNSTVQSFKITPSVTNVSKTFMNDPKIGKILLTKTIHVEDINFDNGNPMFMFRVDGKDAYGEDRVCYRIVDFTETYVNSNKDSNGNVSMTVEFDGLYAGDYTACELETSRYSLESVTNIQNGTLRGKNVHFSLKTTGSMEGAATFINDNYEQQNFSDSAKIINEFIK